MAIMKVNFLEKKEKYNKKIQFYKGLALLYNESMKVMCKRLIHVLVLSHFNALPSYYLWIPVDIE